MSRAASLRRNATTPAADSSETHRAGSALGMAARFAGVSIVLGRMALTRTPVLEHLGGHGPRERHDRRLRRRVGRRAARSSTAARRRASRPPRCSLACARPSPGGAARRLRCTVSTLAVIIACHVVVALLFVERLAPAPGARDERRERRRAPSSRSMRGIASAQVPSSRDVARDDAAPPAALAASCSSRARRARASTSTSRSPRAESVRATSAPRAPAAPVTRATSVMR